MENPPSHEELIRQFDEELRNQPRYGFAFYDDEGATYAESAGDIFKRYEQQLNIAVALPKPVEPPAILPEVSGRDIRLLTNPKTGKLYKTVNKRVALRWTGKSQSFLDKQLREGVIDSRGSWGKKRISVTDLIEAYPVEE